MSVHDASKRADSIRPHWVWVCKHSVMRAAVAFVSAGLLAVGCSSGSSDSSSPSPQKTESATTQPTATAGMDSCDLLSAEELATFAGSPVGQARPELVGGLPACQWPTDAGFVQVGSLSAEDWAQGLPELVRTMNDAGLALDADDERALQEIRETIEAGRDLTATEACSAFSKMLELQGEPAGTTSTIRVWPSESDPQAMSGQMCSAGRFTTVTIAETAGLVTPLPGGRVMTALRLAHRRSIG